MSYPAPRRRPRAALLAAFAAATMLAGCGGSDKAPAGQIVAKVDGEDVTRRDVAAELAAAKLGSNVDMKKIQTLVVDQIVARKLLVEEARKEGVDKTPDFLAAEQRAREVVLAGMLADRWTDKVTPPTQDEVQRFIADNPQMFAQRSALQLDQIRTSAKGIDAAALKPLNTNEAVAAWLTANKRPFERTQAALDTAALKKDIYGAITALPPGMPFVINENGTMLINAVIGSRPTALPQGQWAAVATKAITGQAQQDALRNQIKSLRAAAKITYQDGFAPGAQPSGAARP